MPIVDETPNPDEWMTTFPIPKKEAAEFVKQGYEMRYEDVEIDESSEGFVVKYRMPRKDVK